MPHYREVVKGVVDQDPQSLRNEADDLLNQFAGVAKKILNLDWHQRNLVDGLGKFEGLMQLLFDL